MNNFKSTLTCSYCSKTLKNPIELPCKHHFCKQHLAEKDNVKQKRIKCTECKQHYEVKDNDFETINLIKQLLESNSFL